MYQRVSESEVSRQFLSVKACVTIYSENRYQTYDLDYVTYEDIRKVKKALYGVLSLCPICP